MLKRNVKLMICISILVSLIVILSGCGQKKVEPGGNPVSEPIKIGFLGAKTGNTAIYGLGNLKGIKFAVDEINENGGILGRQVVLIEDDNAGQKDQAINITNKFITQDKVHAIIGDPLTGLTRVAGQIANSKNTVIMSAGCTGPGVVEIGPYVYRNTLLDSVAAPATMKFIVEEMGWKNVAMIISKNSDYSVGVSEVFREAIEEHGGNIIVEVYIQDGDIDFSAQVTKIKSANPDVIVFGGYYTEAALIMKKVREVGMTDIVLVGGDGLQSEDLVKIGGSAVDGTISFAGFSPEEPTEKTQQFINAFKAKHNELPDLFAANGYDAVMLLAKAMTDANSSDSSVYKEFLAKTKNYEGVSGTITFRDDREVIKSPVFLLQVKDGQFTLLKKVQVPLN
jgi:branched-chain amino acid transport system substrate-binding protein